MMDIGWSELFVIAVIALVVIGPRDIPKVLYELGKWVRRARGLTRELHRHVDDLVREAELDDLKKQANAVRHYDLRGEVERAIDPTGDLRHGFDPTGTSRSGPLPGEGSGPTTPAPTGNAGGNRSNLPDPSFDDDREPDNPAFHGLAPRPTAAAADADALPKKPGRDGGS